MRFMIMIIVLLWATNSFSELPHRPTPAEEKRLPAFCAWKYHEKPAEMKRGFSMLGEQFKNSHHFCNGLNYLNRYYRSSFDPNARSYLFKSRLEFNYMINHLVPNSSLAGHSYLYRGIVYRLEGENLKALNDFQKAITYNPKLSKAYAMMADYYSKNGQRGEALKIVTKGLKHVPHSKALKRRYLSLGGKKPFPQPEKLPGKGKYK